MSIRLDGIHFLVTYRCTYACDHCFVWGSPHAEGTMTLAQLTSVIDQAAACGVESVYFEGGEPTLAYPIVLAAAAHARRRGLDWGIVSNCFWATSVADAKVWLAPFVELGISDLSLSSYAYFVEDADEDRLRNAVLAARELGLPMAVLEVGAAACLDIPGLCLGEDVGEIMCKGRAAVELAPGRAARPPETLVTCPFEDFAVPGRAHLGCDGELQLCQGISAGNVFAGGADGAGADGTLVDAGAAAGAGADGVLVDAGAAVDEGAPDRAAAGAGAAGGAAQAPGGGGLAAVLEGYDPARRPVVAEILAGGPWALARAYGHTPRRALYADECHLCYEVRSALRERFPDVLAPAQCYGLTAVQPADAPEDQPA